MSGLIDYIHLNPVRAGLCGVESLREHGLSSYPKYWKRRVPPGLDRGAVLSLHGLADNLAGMRQYARLLSLREESDPWKRVELDRKYCRGWFPGSAGARKKLAEELAREEADARWEGKEFRDLSVA